MKKEKQIFDPEQDQIFIDYELMYGPLLCLECGCTIEESETMGCFLCKERKNDNT